NFIGLLKCVRLAKPARRQFFNVYNFASGVSGGKIVEDARCLVLRAIVNRNNFEIGVIEGDQRGQGSGEFFSFIASRKNERNPRAVSVGSGRRGFQPGKGCCAVYSL